MKTIKKNSYVFLPIWKKKQTFCLPSYCMGPPPFVNAPSYVSYHLCHTPIYIKNYDPAAQRGGRSRCHLPKKPCECWNTGHTVRRRPDPGMFFCQTFRIFGGFTFSSCPVTFLAVPIYPVVRKGDSNPALKGPWILFMFLFRQKLTFFSLELDWIELNWTSSDWTELFSIELNVCQPCLSQSYRWSLGLSERCTSNFGV